LQKPFPLPQILFFFKIDPETSLSRIGGRETREIYEKVDFLKATEERYEKIVSEYERTHPEMKTVRIDATKPKEEVAAAIMAELKPLLG
jgi:dTMP kinase